MPWFPYNIPNARSDLCAVPTIYSADIGRKSVLRFAKLDAGKELVWAKYFWIKVPI